MATLKHKKAVPKMSASKKQKPPSRKTRSYVSKDGHAHFKHVGGYYEVTLDAQGQITGSLIGD